MISKNLKKRLFTSILLILLLFFIFNNNLVLVYSLIIMGVLSLLEFFNICNKIIKHKSLLIISNSIFIIYISFFCLIFFLFSNFLQLKIMLFTLLFGCIASDMGGYIFGKLFKGPKLTKVSPNKTYSGSIGSIFLTALTISGFMYYFTNNFSYLILIIAFATSISCQIGDLFFSYLKRKANLKDTGNFLPGHGGVLDRLDGILLGLPIGIIALLFFY
jgi:phosphatidate cytidylyltransferase